MGGRGAPYFGGGRVYGFWGFRVPFGGRRPARGVCGVFGAAWSSLGLKSFGNSSGNSYTKFAILDIMLRFTCG